MIVGLVVGIIALSTYFSI